MKSKKRKNRDEDNKIFLWHYGKRIKRINKVYWQIEFNNLVYKYKSSGNTLDFRSIPNSNKLFGGIQSGNIVAIDVRAQWRLLNRI